MLGLFGTLNLGARSLSVQQQGTEIAGQNLANVNNPAYSRQQLVIQPSPTLQTPIGQQGTGVEAVAITQVRNSLLDGQIQSETSATGSLNTQQQYLEDAQAYLSEQLQSTSSNTSPSGLTASLSNLFNSFQSLSTDPSSLTQRQAVIQSAQQVSSQFQQINSQLNTVRSGLNASITNDVNGVNQDLSDIAGFNQQIIAAQASGGTANDLIDEREQTLEDLAGKINFTTSAEGNGSVDVSIGGHAMVTGQNVVDSLEAYDAGGGSLKIETHNLLSSVTPTGGSIQGAIEARDGTLTQVQNGISNLASQLITQVNSIYSAGYDLNGNTGADLFTGTGVSTISVNSALAADPSQFQASGTAGAAGDNTVALALAQLSNTSLTGLNNQTFSQGWAQTVQNFGDSLSSVNDQVTSSSSVAQMLSSQRSSYSGVSVDEEMTNLMQYQKAYEASAELITTINQMLQTVVSMKTV